MFTNAKQESVSYLAHLMTIVLKAKKYALSFHRLVCSIFDVAVCVNYGHQRTEDYQVQFIVCKLSSLHTMSYIVLKRKSTTAGQPFGKLTATGILKKCFA